MSVRQDRHSATARRRPPSLTADPEVIIFLSRDPAGDTAWQDQALCAQSDPEAWFPEKGGSVRAPKLICRGCPVQAACLDYAMEHDLRHGVWGGLSERERDRLKRSAKEAA